ncbi:MAG: zf-HC2 domain-containing protein [Oscillospiraceae bacterium]|jgi:hypothetical protein|nr:zf-HC2 domain-containing protein [Oscillospiraceae bacterium]
MTCRRFRVLLNDWVDGTLSPEAARAMDEHAAACEDCAMRRAAMDTWLTDAQAAGAALPVPTDVQIAWRQAVRQEAAAEGALPTRASRAAQTATLPAQKPRRMRWIWVARPAAMAVAAVALVIVLGQAILPMGARPGQNTSNYALRLTPVEESETHNPSERTQAAPQAAPAPATAMGGDIAPSERLHSAIMDEPAPDFALPEDAQAAPQSAPTAATATDPSVWGNRMPPPQQGSLTGADASSAMNESTAPFQGQTAVPLGLGDGANAKEEASTAPDAVFEAVLKAALETLPDTGPWATSAPTAEEKGTPLAWAWISAAVLTMALGAALWHILRRRRRIPPANKTDQDKKTRRHTP